MGKQQGKFWPQVRAMIWEKAEELFMAEQARTMDFYNRPEKCELREGGYFHEAKLIVLRNLWREKDCPAWKRRKPRMALFKRKHIRLIKQGIKTQTRRVHKAEWKIGRCYAIRDRYFTKGEGKIMVTRKFKQRLGDVSEVDVRKEGYNNLAEFQKAWEEIHGEGSWNPAQIVTVYEFVFYKKETV